jgi:hypothetical protein
MDASLTPTPAADSLATILARWQFQDSHVCDDKSTASSPERDNYQS